MHIYISLALRVTVSDVSFHCDNSGVSCNGMDKAHHSIVLLRFPASVLERCDGQSVDFRVNVTKLRVALDCAGDDDTCTIAVGLESSLLYLSCKSETSGSFLLVYLFPPHIHGICL